MDIGLTVPLSVNQEHVCSELGGSVDHGIVNIYDNIRSSGR